MMIILFLLLSVKSDPKKFLSSLMHSFQSATNDSKVITSDSRPLSDYFGIYNGTTNEISDPWDRCHLTLRGNPSLELSSDAFVRLFLNDLPFSTYSEFHSLGKISPIITTNSLSLITINCSPLPGTNFPGKNCKRLFLSGIFSKITDARFFRGIYSITDNVTEESCSYNLILIREVVSP